MIEKEVFYNLKFNGGTLILMCHRNFLMHPIPDAAILIPDKHKMSLCNWSSYFCHYQKKSSAGRCCLFSSGPRRNTNSKPEPNP